MLRPNEKTVLIAFAERFHDPETTISYFENLNREKEKEKVNSSIRKAKTTKSKKPEK
jgi:hypothetical protein